MAAFPVAKLAAVLLRQISKPIANYAKQKAKSSYFMRNYVCMPPAQFYHWCEVKVKMWAMNLGRPVEIPKLNEAMAIELGADLLGEAIIFTVASVILVAEYVRQKDKEAAKEQDRADHLQEIVDKLRECELEASRQDAQLRELTRLCFSLQGKQETAKTVERDPPEVASKAIFTKEDSENMPAPVPATNPVASEPAASNPVAAAPSVTNVAPTGCEPKGETIGRSQGVIMKAAANLLKI